MSAPSAQGAVTRVRAALATTCATVLGAAPHVPHHVGPLAGAALLAGATGKLLFGALGLLLAGSNAAAPAASRRNMATARRRARADGRRLRLLQLRHRARADRRDSASNAPVDRPAAPPAEHQEHHR
jgi:hypothetical protein